MKINKNILFLMGMTLSALAAPGQQPYHVTGRMPGVPDGTKVYLLDYFGEKKKDRLDSAVTKDGSFVLQGKKTWGMVRRCNILVDCEPGNLIKSKQVGLFMGDETVTISAPHIDSVPAYYYTRGGNIKYVAITGAAEQARYEAFKAESQQQLDRAEELRLQYNKEFHVPAAEGVFNTAQGMAMMRELRALRAKINARKIDFIRQYPQSTIAALLAYELMVSARSRYTIKEIDDIMGSLNIPRPAGAQIIKKLDAAAADAKATAKGVRFIDLPLTDQRGKPVQLSQYVKPGQYTLLEFWSSHCGPCRNQIPHMRHLSELVSQKDFSIISISIDEKDAEWKKALREEKMPWTQLLDKKGSEGPTVTLYKIEGIPHSVLVDPQGYIVESRINGAELDVVLKELLGEKITTF
ncbi:TlpA disulfide reductase family protein [Chitinophaga varians]|uniref:TlpA disulfide reductase family protein n=1 Tax=Chitinophaga varians TaxID=2202339 RepID=UPI00165EF5C5|nr:TlpA disulfide reductase family protein [Chitinophaga varians]MBC9914941.1 AhpC/TSA family protein [Chitinophaga varians]